jgi:hypothetical protein
VNGCDMQGIAANPSRSMCSPDLQTANRVTN